MSWLVDTDVMKATGLLDIRDTSRHCDALGRERSRHKGAGASMLEHLLGRLDAE